MSGVADLSQASLAKFASVAKDKVVLLTGTTEIGNLLAVQFANAGAKIVIGDVDEVRGAAVVDSITKFGGTASFQRTDISIWEHQLLLFELAIEMHGRVDILPLALREHDTSGFDAPFDETADAPPEPDLSSLSVNQDGLLFTTKLAMHYLFRSDASPKALVFLSVDATAGDLRLGPALSAAKFGAIGVQRTLLATAPPDIRLCVVATAVPGADASAPNAALIAQTLFYAATDPSSSTRGAVYSVPITAEATKTAVKCISNNSLSISTVEPYKSMLQRFAINDCSLHFKVAGHFKLTRLRDFKDTQLPQNVDISVLLTL